jgi:hypothetical protein
MAAGVYGREVVHLIADKKQSKWKEPGTKYNLQRYAYSDLPPPTRPYLLMFLETAKMSSLAGDQAFYI